MVRDGYQNGKEKYDFSPLSISRFFMLFFIPFVAYSIGLLPSIVSFIYIWGFLDLNNPLHVLILPFILTFEFLVFILFESIVPGLFIKIFRIKCNEGEHELSIKDKNFFNFSLHVILYRPPLVLLNLFKLLPVRMLFLRLAGLKAGKTALLPGTEVIYDPYLTEIGEQTLIGSYAKVTAHIVENKLIMKRVQVGNNCLIGADSFIMPGAVIEDGAVVGAKSLVLKDQVIGKGKVYGGIPAKEIKKRF